MNNHITSLTQPTQKAARLISSVIPAEKYMNLMKSKIQNPKELKGIPRFVATISLATIISALFAVISRLGVPYLSHLLAKLPFYVILFLSLVTLLLFVFSFGTVPYTFRGIGLPGPSETIQAILSLIAILLFLWTIPALIIYWTINPDNLKKAIKIGVFLSSSALSMVFYLSNKKLFKSPVDIVSFFSGACFGPVAIIEILL